MSDATSITLLLPADTIAKMKSFYADSLLPPTTPYMEFMAKEEGVTISAYKKSKDGYQKVLFQGEKAAYESSLWGKTDETTKKNDKPSFIPAKGDQIGSDEVGTGDFFGPVIVVAAYVSKEGLPYLKELGVTDSKLLSDEKILQIVPELIQRLPYSALTCDNAKYNEVQSKGLNMNAIKARMHNRCLLNLAHKYPKAKVYQDQFAAPALYFSYLKQEKEVLRDITFATKGETKFPCVALASCIARYSFLRHMEEMGKKYGCVFPLGSGEAVDVFATEFVKKYGKEELYRVAKANFANMGRI